MQNNADNQLMVVIVPQELKDDLVDSLIDYDEITGFSLNQIQGYSREHAQYNLQEQVEGYRKFYRFDIFHKFAKTTELVNHLRHVSHGNAIRYWCIPVSECGVV